MKDIVIVLLIVMIMSSTALACNNSKMPQPQSWMGIIPGTTTGEDVLTILGESAEKESYNVWEVDSYPSKEEGSFHQIALKEGIVQLIVVIISPDEEYTLEAAEQEFGEPEKVTYSYLMRGTKTYIFARQGVTIIVQEEEGTVFQKHYYIPMPLDEYMNSWGKELPESDPFIY